MLMTALLHPQILHALGQSGHGSRILIADGNYPFNTGSNPSAEHVYLNLRPGLITTIDALETLAAVTPIEAAHVMDPYDHSEPPIFAEFRRALPGLDLQRLERFTFYDTSRERDVALVIATGEQRHWSNILLTIGVVPPA